MWADKQGLKYISSVSTVDAVYKTCKESRIIGTDDERQSLNSTLSAQLDDDNIYIYIMTMIYICIYIYVYICVCVCVCVRERERERERDRGGVSLHLCLSLRVYFLYLFSASVIISIDPHTFSLSLSLSLSHTHTHTHTHIYIYIYIELCIFMQQVIQANFVEDDGTPFIIFNFIFSGLLVIFLVSASGWKRNCPISSAQAILTFLWSSSWVM